MLSQIDPLHLLQSAVLQLLAEHGPISVNALLVLLQSDASVKVSLPTLYRLLAQMSDKQIIVRTHGTVALHHVWVSRIGDFVERAKSSFASEQGATLRLNMLREGEKRIFTADSLLELDTVWSYMILELSRTTDEREWFVYNSHPWYSLGMRDTETRLNQSIVSAGIHCHLLFGNDAFLDRYGEKAIRVPGYETTVASDTGFPTEGVALWSCGEYVMECIFPPAISRHFAFFFQTIQRIEDFDPELFADIFRMQARCKVTVRRSAEESHRIRNMIEPYFKISEHNTQ